MNEPLKPPCCNPIVVPVLDGVFIGDMGRPTQDIIHPEYQKVFKDKEQIPFGGQRYTVHGKTLKTILIKDKTGLEYSYSDLIAVLRKLFEEEYISFCDENFDSYIKDLIYILKSNPTQMKELTDIFNDIDGIIPCEDALHDMVNDLIEEVDDSSIYYICRLDSKAYSKELTSLRKTLLSLYAKGTHTTSEELDNYAMKILKRR